MGEYDALFDPAPKPAAGADHGEYGALFDDGAPPPASEPSAWERIKGGLGSAAHRVGESFSNFGHTVASGVNEAVRLASPLSPEGSYHVPFSDLTDPSYRHQAERGVSDVVTGGLAERAANAVSPEFAATAEGDQATNPRARAMGNVAGAALPSPFNYVGGQAARLIPGKGALAGAARGAVAYQGAAGTAGAVAAPAGHRLEGALEAATDPAGLVLGAGAGAAASVAPRAKELIAKRAQDRMVDQAVKDIAGSRGTGLSSRTDREMIRRQIEPLKEELRQPDAIKIADTARQDPGAAWEMVQKKVDGLTTERKASYAAVDSATGGVHVKEFRRYLADALDDLSKNPGQQAEQAAVQSMIKDVDNTWGHALNPAVDTIDFRKYVTRLQRTAADTMGGLEETRRVQILNHVSGLAKGFLDRNLDVATKMDPGLRPVVDGLKEQNRRTAAWLSLEDALKTRAGKLDTDNMVDNKPKALAAGVAGATAAMHYLHSPAAAVTAATVGAAPYVVPPIDRAVTRAAARMTPGAPANPASVARLIQMARAGATRQQLQAQAEQDGTPVELASNIAMQNGR